MADVHELLDTWIANVKDEELLAELNTMKEQGDEDAITDAFFQDLAFGTAGLRGTIGAGTNRMNIYTVGRATQGFADYLNATFEHPTVAIARDSRNKGELFVKTTAAILAANGVTALVYPKISPVPTLSWAVRDLKCSGGICMTASHNPAPYNGYKAYGPDGCQITLETADAVSKHIGAVDHFDGVRLCGFADALADGTIRMIGEDCLEAFLDAVERRSVWDGDRSALRVVYTPLNGTGRECVTKILSRIGVTDVTLVPEQAWPDGSFPTCPYPNPEERAALERGLALARKTRADLLLGTDPDCDRMGAAVPDGGDYRLLTGNEMGVLLLDYLCRRRSENGTMPARPVAVTTIVSTDMADAVAAHYGVELRRTLTGFKFIGEQIGELEKAGEAERYLFGFEESYGYLSGPHVRDKDAVNAALLCCEMAAWYRAQGMTLAQAMDALYEKFGYYRNELQSVVLPGEDGMERMSAILTDLRAAPPHTLAGERVTRVRDYLSGLDGLPAGDVLELRTAHVKVIVRPSGTEPKLKLYYSAHARTMEETAALCAAARRDMSARLGE